MALKQLEDMFNERRIQIGQAAGIGQSGIHSVCTDHFPDLGVNKHHMIKDPYAYDYLNIKDKPMSHEATKFQILVDKIRKKYNDMAEAEIQKLFDHINSFEEKKVK